MDGVGGEDDRKPTSRDSNAALGEKFAQSFHGAAHAFLRRVFADAQLRADRAQILVLEKAQQQGDTLRFSQFTQ